MQRSAIFWMAAMMLIAVVSCIWYAVLQEDRHGLLTVSFLDIGQGDSIFIESPSGRQALIDGGANGAVFRELSKVMPWYDRSIDVVIGTHPDADHIGGLAGVLDRYRVSYVVESSVKGNTAAWYGLEDAIGASEKRGTKDIVAQRGQVIDLGSGAYLEVLSPDRSVPNVDTNVGCVVTRLVYGNTAFMLSCDAPQAVEKYLVTLDGPALRSDVLKAGHHGSRTSSSAVFVGSVDPQYAVFSRGCDNKYGHPHKEIVALFKNFGIPTEDTCKQGTVTFVSDGQNVRLK